MHVDVCSTWKFICQLLIKPRPSVKNLSMLAYHRQDVCLNPLGAFLKHEPCFAGSSYPWPNDYFMKSHSFKSPFRKRVIACIWWTCSFFPAATDNSIVTNVSLAKGQTFHNNISLWPHKTHKQRAFLRKLVLSSHSPIVPLFFVDPLACDSDLRHSAVQNPPCLDLQQ